MEAKEVVFSVESRWYRAKSSRIDIILQAMNELDAFFASNCDGSS